MKNNEFKILLLLTLGLLLLVIGLGMRIETLQHDLDNERYNKDFIEDLSTVPNSLSDGGYCCMERLR